MNFTEIFKLKEMLDAEGIPNTLAPLWDGLQIKVFINNEKIEDFDDVVLHSGSHGNEKGLLETYNLNSCNGYETAEQVFKGWKEIFKKFSKTY